MKRTLVTIMLLGLLVLTSYQVNAITPTALPVPAAQELYMPRNVQMAYEERTRSPAGNPGEKYWQNKAVHSMSITVAPPNRTVSATEEITYTNNSPKPLGEVIFRLYQNVHTPEGLQELYFTKDFLTSGIQIDEFRVNGEVKEWAPHPASGLTWALIPLAQPLAPNTSIKFSFKWHYDLAVEHVREGVIDETTFYLAYFFPRIAVANDTDFFPAPGWDTEEFTSGIREFYNDFADFTFEVNVPKNFIVWATGDLQNPAEVLQPTYAQRLQDSFTSDQVINIAQPEELKQGLVTAQTNTVTWKWKAENVPDIAIGLSDHYIWDAGSLVVDPATNRRASVQAAYNPEATDFRQMVEFGKSALAFGSTQYPGVPYPYSKSTIVRGDANMEYPMMANDSSNPENPALTRAIAAHELLHSWFPFYMGTNEQRYGFMDEGLTVTFDYLINTRDYGEAWATALFQETSSGYLVPPFPGAEIPIITPSDSLRGDIVGLNNYAKAAPGFLALKELMGDELFKQSLHEFIDRWNGKHPLPWDMFNTFNDASGQNYNWFFNNWFFSTNYLDLAVGEVQKTDGGYTVQVRNVGGMAMPFDVNVVYADDTKETFHRNPGIWKGSPLTATVAIDSSKELKSLTLEGGIFMDVSPENNTWVSP